MLFLLLACNETPQDTGPASPTATVHLAWSAHEGLWETDLGWSVTLEQGWLVSTGVELLNCPTEDPGKDHGEAMDERLHAPHVEALHAPEDQVMGTLRMDLGELCAAAWHVGRPTRSDEVVGLPIEVDLIDQGLSLYLEGTASQAGRDPLPFAGGSSLEGGQELVLAERVGTADLSLHVVRDPETLFDGIDFEALTTGEIADAAIVNLALATRFELD